MVVSLRIVCAESDLERLEKARQLSKLWGVRSLTFHDSVSECCPAAAGGDWKNPACLVGYGHDLPSVALLHRGWPALTRTIASLPLPCS